MAVDRSEVVNQGGEQKKILQPVEMPAGWEMAEAGVRFCIAAAPAGVAAVVRQAMSLALPEAGGMAFRSRKLFRGPRPRPRTVADVVKDIRSFLAKTKYLGRLKPKATVEHLAAIVAMIDELASLLRQSGHPVLVEVENALNDGRSYVAELAGSSLTTPDAAKMQEYLARVVAILDAIEKPPEEKPERKEFWL